MLLHYIVTVIIFATRSMSLHSNTATASNTETSESEDTTVAEGPSLDSRNAIFNITLVSNSLTRGKNLDIKSIMAENSKYKPMADYCSLKIFGGVKGDLKFLPYQVSLSYETFSEYQSFCGGCLVTLRYGFSAAHCFYMENNNEKIDVTYIVAGTMHTRHGKGQPGQVRRVEDVFIPPHYKDTTMHDFSVFEVNKPFLLSKTVQPIKISTNSHALFREGKRCLVSGFGQITEGVHSDVLRMVCLPLVDDKKCKDIFQSDVNLATSFCAGEQNKDSCVGDSGGPLACDGTLVGVVSAGARCGDLPAVYTRVSVYTIGDTYPVQPLRGGSLVTPTWKIHHVLIYVYMLQSI